MVRTDLDGGSAPAFRPTVWPGGRITPEQAIHRTADVMPGGTVEYFPPGELRELPEELVLRELLGLDVDNDEDLLAFVNDFGMIARRCDDQYSSTAGAHRYVPADAAGIEHLRWWIRTAQILSRHWIASMDGDSVTDVWASQPVWNTGLVASSNDAWYEFTRWINIGLAAYQVRVEIEVGLGRRVITVGPPPPDLYSAICLQLANLIEVAPSIRRCASETCTTAFVHQRGTAAYGQYRSDSRYCSRQCAKNQAERERRRRRRKEKQ